MSGDMKKSLADFEKILRRQLETGFAGRINILNSSNDEIMGHLFITEGLISHFYFINRQGFTGLNEFVFLLFKGLQPKFILEPEILNPHKANIYISNNNDFVKEMHRVYEKMVELKDFIPANKVLVKMTKNVFFGKNVLNISEFFIALLVVKFREIGKILGQSKYSELETIEALVSLRKMGCLKVIAS